MHRCHQCWYKFGKLRNSEFCNRARLLCDDPVLSIWYRWLFPTSLVHKKYWKGQLTLRCHRHTPVTNTAYSMVTVATTSLQSNESISCGYINISSITRRPTTKYINYITRPGEYLQKVVSGGKMEAENNGRVNPSGKRKRQNWREKNVYNAVHWLNCSYRTALHSNSAGPPQCDFR